MWFSPWSLSVQFKQRTILCSSTKLSYDLCTVLRRHRKAQASGNHTGLIDKLLKCQYPWLHPKKEHFMMMFAAYPTSCFKTEHLCKIGGFIFNQIALINLLLLLFLPPAVPWLLPEKASRSEQSLRCQCVRCFKSVGFLGFILPLVLHSQLLHDVFLFSGAALSVSPVQQWTSKGITSQYSVWFSF